MKTKIKITEEQYEKFAELLEKSIHCQAAYQCEHDDAGSAYARMPREGDFDYSCGDSRLKEWLKENDLIIPEEDYESFVDEVLDWSNINPGHQFSNPENNGDFLVGSFPVGEIEDQYCIDDLVSLLDTDISTAKEFAAMAMKDNRFFLKPNGDGGVVSYTYTDAVWNFTIDVEWAKDRI